MCIKLLGILVFFNVKKLFLCVELVNFIVFLINFFGDLILNIKVFVVILLMFKNCFIVKFDNMIKIELLNIMIIEGVL